MTLIKHMIETQIPEEQSDHDYYENLANELDNAGYPNYACIIRDISREEETHKHHLESILEDLQ